MNEELRVEIEKMISRQNKLCQSKNGMLLQGQGVQTKMIKDLSENFNRFMRDFNGNGKPGLKDDIILNSNHRIKVDWLLNNATSKIIGMIIVTVLGTGGVVAAVMTMAK